MTMQSQLTSEFWISQACPERYAATHRWCRGRHCTCSISVVRVCGKVLLTVESCQRSWVSWKHYLANKPSLRTCNASCMCVQSRVHEASSMRMCIRPVCWDCVHRGVGMSIKGNGSQDRHVRRESEVGVEGVGVSIVGPKECRSQGQKPSEMWSTVLHT